MNTKKPLYHQFDPTTTLSQFIDIVDKECDPSNRDPRVLATPPNRKVDPLFRGQSADWTLLPKLARMDWKNQHKGILHSESILMQEFERTAARFSIGFADMWEQLAVAQHHGLPTRYTDWSYNAIAALWMAVKDGVKYDRVVTKREDGSQHFIEKPLDGVVWLLRARQKDFLSPHDRKPDPFTLKQSAIYRSRVIADRISAQSGIFVAHTLVKDEFIPLEMNSLFGPRLIKIQIPHGCFGTIRESLQKSGVNDATMYPDIDGLCRHLTWRYTHRTLAPKMATPLDSPEGK